MSREVMKQALEALDSYSINDFSGYEVSKHKTHIIDNAITAVKEALAQQEHPEQMARLGWQYVECPACGSEGARAFPKPEQEQCTGCEGKPSNTNNPCAVCGKAQPDKFDTAPPQPKTDQEPVEEYAEHMYQSRDGSWKLFEDEDHYQNTVENGTWPIRKIHTSPPQREWVGLTNLEVWKVYQQCQDELTRPPTEDFAFKFADKMQAKLKEKNA